MLIRVGVLTAPHIDYVQQEQGFLLRKVRIGIGFHWDRHEDQAFEGQLEIVQNADGTETAVNVLDLEDYLTSVISSEMSADSPLELLKAHAVISRSWAMNILLGRNSTGHEGYDVCGDDHCQRYEGTLRRNPRAVEAVRATQGQVLTYAGEICDTRYHKCCGGKTERFATCWEDRLVSYLTPVDCPYCGRAVGNTRLLRLVLNNYDQETQDFHDWEVRYTQAELAEIIRTKSGKDFGEIVALRPLLRGGSGRIYSLEIVGTKRTETIGKELTIRYWLSRSCLYSSWFEVENLYDNTESMEQGREASSLLQPSVPGAFVLHGHGWGHGVGLCQIGAAEMAAEGASYEAILTHYYPYTTIQTR